MAVLTPSRLFEQLELAESLRAGRKLMLEPQDLPVRYGRVVQAVERVLHAVNGEAVLGGGWAVWRHGYIGRITQNLDIALPAALVPEFLRVSALAGFDELTVPEGRWPKAIHRETGIQLDILPEGATPGTAAHPAPTQIPHPAGMGAAGTRLRYINLVSLIELKLAAGRAKDNGDVVELIRANPHEIGTIRQHLAGAHASYANRFEALAVLAQEQDER